MDFVNLFVPQKQLEVETMNKNILLCGVGGQGTVLASKVLAGAAIEKGYEVKTTETIGMAQRGGCVVSHVRMGEAVHSPIIPYGKADIILGFEPAEVVRNLKYLKEDGIVVVSEKAIKPVTVSLSGSAYEGKHMLTYLKQQVKNVYIVDGEKICEECGSEKVLNVALLGTLLSLHTLPVEREALLQVMLRKLPEKLHAMNLHAFQLGEAYGK